MPLEITDCFDDTLIIEDLTNNWCNVNISHEGEVKAFVEIYREDAVKIIQHLSKIFDL